MAGGEIFKVEFFHPCTMVEISTLWVEILDHLYKWNYPPIQDTVYYYTTTSG